MQECPVKLDLFALRLETEKHAADPGFGYSVTSFSPFPKQFKPNFSVGWYNIKTYKVLFKLIEFLCQWIILYTLCESSGIFSVFTYPKPKLICTTPLSF